MRFRSFASLMLVGITLTAAFSHLMEMPAKMRYEPALYVRLHRTLYNNYGRIAGITEVLSVLVTIELAWKLRKLRSRTAPTAITAAACLALADGLFWAFVSPANTTMASWPLNEIPADWTRWRDQWEYTHAVRAVLILTAFAALSLSVVRGTSTAVKPSST